MSNMPLDKLKPIVLVRWGDAWANNGRYYDESDDYEPIEMRSLGFLMQQTDTVVVLCTDNADDGAYRKLSSIPVVNIIEIIYIDVEL